MRLIEAAQGKDNNFNLIRLIAALAVLVTHSFAIATGNPELEPLRGWLGMTIGDFAVDAFFITSGFLVTASLARRQSGLEFVCARVLRIYPALLVMVALTVFVVGPLLSRLSPVSPAWLVRSQPIQGRGQRLAMVDAMGTSHVHPTARHVGVG
jgi:peptidoglycan/LPS O-acetylase OafA/YrhL